MNRYLYPTFRRPPTPDIFRVGDRVKVEIYKNHFSHGTITRMYPNTPITLKEDVIQVQLDSGHNHFSLKEIISHE